MDDQGESLHSNLGGIIPPELQFLIQRPLRHYLLGGPGACGFLVMEFNRQIFREDVYAARDRGGNCPACGVAIDTLAERYAGAIQQGVERIKRRLIPAVERARLVLSGHFDHDA